MNQFLLRSIEFLLLFITIPIILCIAIPISFKIGLVILGFIYILYILFYFEKIKLKIKSDLPWKHFWKRTFIIFIIIIITTTVYVLLTEPKLLFIVPFNKPLLFIIILLVYTLLSVWPQEIIYRTFFMERYSLLFKNKIILVLVNALVFSLAHLFFKNTLVLILTFVGGILFGFTYLRYRSTTLVSIEHAIYGNWLFTVGMGEMLMFPGIDS